MIWIQTRSGRLYDLLDPKPDQIVLADVCTAAAYLNRFTGHVGLCSVAEHVIRVSYLVPPHLAREALVHDLHEVVTNDVSSPAKYALRHIAASDRRRRSDFDVFEELHARAFRARFGVPASTSNEVRIADIQSLAFEKERAWAGTPDPRLWELPATPPPDLSRMPAALLCEPLEPQTAKAMLSSRAATLGLT